MQVKAFPSRERSKVLFSPHPKITSVARGRNFGTRWSENIGLDLLVPFIMREIVHLQAGQCGNQIGAKVRKLFFLLKVTTFFNRISNAESFFSCSKKGMVLSFRILCNLQALFDSVPAQTLACF